MKRTSHMRALALALAALACTTCNLVWQSGDYSFDGAEPCTTASDCPGSADGCVRPTCDEGVCGLDLVAAGEPLSDAAQVAGDCSVRVCDGNGEALSDADDADVPVDDDPCTDDVCSDGEPDNPHSALGTPCGAGQVCDGHGICTSEQCVDGEMNGVETDIDCGGGDCHPCHGGLMCNAPTDCESGVCIDNICKYPTCIDTVQNGDETDVDCGGTVCEGCADGLDCLGPSDCESGVCDMAVCQMPTCIDSVRNGSETDVDCGATCPDCPDGETCAVPGDCQSGICTLNLCVPAPCNDNMLSSGETDIDCGGVSCAPCADGDDCLVPTDCISGVCQGGTCVMGGCGDMTLNGDETDVDCGGSCPPCAVGDSCLVHGDCVTTVCTQLSCAPLNGCNPVTAADYTASSQVTVNFQGGGNMYTPPCIRIVPGTTVTFVGNFSPHPLEGGKVISGITYPDNMSPFWPTTSSGSMKSFVLSQLGQFPYYCPLHAGGGMYGTVFVE